MPILTFANPKGGAGKSTACLIAAQEIARRGASVSIIESDPMRWISRWGDLNPEACPNISVGAIVNADDLPAAIHAEAGQSDYVLIDTEGSKNMAVAHAITMADLVVIPIQPSALDSEAASEAIGLIRAQEIATRRSIPFTLVFNRVGAAIETRSAKAIRLELAEAGLPVLGAGLVERAAFRDLFAFGGDLADLPRAEVNGVEKALANAALYTDAVLDTLTMEATHAA